MTSRKQRARKAIRYGLHLQTRTETQNGGIIFPPSVTIAYAHHRINKTVFPLMSRRQWKKMKAYT